MTSVPAGHIILPTSPKQPIGSRNRTHDLLMRSRALYLVLWTYVLESMILSRLCHLLQHLNRTHRLSEILSDGNSTTKQQYFSSDTISHHSIVVCQGSTSVKHAEYVAVLINLGWFQFVRFQDRLEQNLNCFDLFQTCRCVSVSWPM